MYNHATRLLAYVFICLMISACGSGGGGSSNASGLPDNDNPPSGGSSSSSSGGQPQSDFSAVFASIADNVIIPGYQDVATRATSYTNDTGALAAYCSAIGTADEASTLAQAQLAWSQLMVSWQRAEVFQISRPDLRDRIHSYGAGSLNSGPGYNTCIIDVSVIDAEQDGFNLSNRILDARGLSAVEYLLFADSLEHTCPSDNTTVQGWNERPELERQMARCAYAQLAADDVAAAATEANAIWTDGSQRDNLLNSPPEQVLQAISDAMFYIETFTKDAKLGITTGIKAAGSGPDFCDAAACPERVESPFSASSFQNIRANLESFQDMYNAGGGVGFDDVIADLGLASVNEGFSADITAALAAIDDVIDAGDTIISQSQMLLGNADSVVECANVSSAPSDQTPTAVSACRIYALVKRITDRLRTDFVTAVGVDLPAASSGDAD